MVVIALFCLVAWPLLGMFLPRGAALGFFGWLTLGWGLLFLQSHVLSTGELNDRFGLGGLVLNGWMVAIAVGTVIAGARALSSGSASTLRTAVGAWSFPIGCLAAAYLFHWLSNRLAGFYPGWVPHLAVVVGGVAIAGLGLYLWARPWLFAPFVVALGATLAALTITAAARGFSAFSHSGSAAQEGPCAITWAGNERSRPAYNGFDVSPLVSRKKGRSPLDHPADDICR